MGVIDASDIHPVNVVKAKVFMMAGFRDLPFATRGDCGSGIFKVTDDGKDVVFGGMVVSEFKPTIGDPLTMWIPAMRLLTQVAKETAVEWEVAVD